MNKSDESRIGKKAYREALYGLQVELVKLQKHIITEGLKILVLLEGRDAAGKDGVIKRITAHLSPRDTRIVALGKPSNREESQWYFQRWIEYLPAGGEIVLFNRSWYNRAGVEKVMGFCTMDEHETFMRTVPDFEAMLTSDGIRLYKYYLDISRGEQKRRMKKRQEDPLKQWKISPVDEKAVIHWDDYSEARNEMLSRTHTAAAPWTVVRADDKRAARLNVIKDLLIRVSYPGKDERLLITDPDTIFTFSEPALTKGLIAP